MQFEWYRKNGDKLTVIGDDLKASDMSHLTKAMENIVKEMNE